MATSSPVLDPTAAFYETPFIYVKNYIQAYTSSAPITGPTGLLNDVIQSQGDSDFLARQTIGCENFQNAAGQYFLSGVTANDQFSTLACNTPIAPEKLYPLGTSIPIQMGQGGGIIGGAPGAFLEFAGTPTAYVNIAAAVFQGVKRYDVKRVDSDFFADE